MAGETRDSVLQAGEYVLDHIEILQANGEGLDVREQVDSITFYEDIYSPFMTGKVTFRDTQDLPHFFGRAGRDLLRVSVGTPGIDEKYKISGYFHLYKMAERELVKDRTQMYNMYFQSSESLFDMEAQISRAYKGTSDKMIGEVIKEYLNSDKAFFAEESKQSHRFISNNWSPAKVINYCAQHAMSPNDDPSFLFYENRDGFNFTTIDWMAKQDPIQSFEESDFTTDVATGKDNNLYFGEVDRNPNKDYKIIQSMEIDVMYDFMDIYQNGGISTKLVTADMLTKKYRTNDYTADVDRKLNIRSLYGPNAIGTSKPMRMTMLKSYGSTDGGDSTNAAFYQKRISELRLLDASKVRIIVFGRSDYTVGKKVYLNTNIVAPIDNSDESKSFEDLNRSGYYIITAIVHKFDRKGHMATIELSKESTKNQ